MTLPFLPLLEQLQTDEHVVVLTANQRLATHILEQYNLLHQQQHSIVWKTPRVLSFGNWLHEAYLSLLAQSHTDKILLNDKQSLFLWQNIINTYNETQEIPLQSYQTSQKCAEAWRILKQWNIKINQHEFSINDDCQAFFQLAQQYEHACQSKGGIDTDTCQQWLLSCYENKLLAFPAKMICVGFIELTPLQENYMSLATRQGTEIVFWENTCQADIKALPCEDTHDELEKMVTWVIQQIKQGETGTILCVIPTGGPILII